MTAAFTPDPEAFAEVAYRVPANTVWHAKVYRHADGWELRFGATPAGTFKNGKALIKYIREKAAAKVGKDAKPIYDNLHKLKGRTPQSVVPDCFAPTFNALVFGGRGLAECVACPYRSKCGEPSAQPETVSTADNEPDEVFLSRLQSKIKERWGK